MGCDPGDSNRAPTPPEGYSHRSMGWPEETMLAFALAGLTAHGFEPQDRDDAWYLFETSRPEEAADWFRARLEAHPDDDLALLDYLSVLPSLPDQRHQGLVAAVDHWGAEHPTPSLVVARVYARILVAMHHSTWTNAEVRYVSPQSGSWCDEVRDWLATASPVAPDVAYRVAEARLTVERACGGETDAAEEAVRTLALEGAGGLAAQASRAMADGVQDDDLAVIDALLEGRPVQTSALWPLFSDDIEGDRVSEARSRVMDAARRHLESERPPILWAIRGILGRANDDDRRKVLERLIALDPDNSDAALELGWMDRAPDSDEEESVPPWTIVDPTERLDGLRASDPGEQSWQQARYWRSWVEAADALDDGAALQRGARGLVDCGREREGYLTWAQGALLLDQRLRKAERMATRAIEWARRPALSQAYAESRREVWRGRLAEAHAVRAEVRLARDDPEGAREDWMTASSLTSPRPAWKVRLGLLADADDVVGLAMLAEGLSERPDLSDDVTEAAWSRVDESIRARELFVSGGAVSLVDAHSPRSAASPEERAELPGELRFTVDGQPATLDDYPGPVVLDLWATWCGPCMESLPHLDALARRYEGRVTMIAVSVDEDEEAARNYLDKRGDAAFVSAFAGVEGKAALGVDGIPAMFVLDAEHRVVEELSGYGSGNRSLDRAVARAVR